MWYSWFIMIQPISVLPHLLNWIIFWIEFFWNFLNWIIFWIEFLWKILNWIIFWIEFSWNTIELNIELNHFLAKFKYWIESIWVSLTPTHIIHCCFVLVRWWSALPYCGSRNPIISSAKWEMDHFLSALLSMSSAVGNQTDLPGTVFVFVEEGGSRLRIWSPFKNRAVVMMRFLFVIYIHAFLFIWIWSSG